MKTTRRGFFGILAATVGAVVLKPKRMEYVYVDEDEVDAYERAGWRRSKQIAADARETQRIMRQNMLDNMYIARGR